MPQKQYRVLQPLTTEANDDTTIRVTLPRSNFLHTILLRCAITNGSTNAQNQTLSDVVDEVKVVGDGSEIITYLEPETIRSHTLLHTGTGLDEVVNEGPDAVQRATYPIFFGLSPWDMNHFLPLAGFDNVEVHIKISPAISPVSFATGSFQYELIGLMTLAGQPGAYNGTLRTRIIRNFTTASSGIEQVEPPQGQLWKHLLVRSYEAGVADGTNITDVAFHVNDEQIMLLDMTWEALVDLNQSLMPLQYTREYLLHRADNDVVTTRQSRLRSAHALPRAANAHATFDGLSGDQLTLNLQDLAVPSAITSDTVLDTLVVSDQIPFSVYIPLEDLFTEGPFSSDQWDNVTLELTQGGAGGDTDVVLTEVVTY